jgi:outer membrane protein assembly factor BamD
MKKNLQFTLLVFLLSLSLFSCSKKDEKNNAEIAYTKATKYLKDKNYSSAAEAFVKIEDDYPFSKWALKAQAMAVYAYYKEEDYAKLTQVVDDFIRLNPANENVPYMMYMKGLSYYNRIPEVTRAQDDTQQASLTFRELIARFPDSTYVPDVREKLVIVDEHIAGAKMSVGRYQIKTRNFVGAINNFTEVTTRYRLTNQVPEAYFRLAEIYYKIGLKKESFAAYQKLNSLFPQDKWLELTKKIDPYLFQ